MIYKFLACIPLIIAVIILQIIYNKARGRGVNKKQNQKTQVTKDEKTGVKND